MSVGDVRYGVNWRVSFVVIFPVSGSPISSIKKTVPLDLRGEKGTVERSFPS